ncbi:FAD-dependent oxidoreductase [Saccharicrinis fermentans]|uniref:3-ketosteroid-delta-1-dehydrogenase n=1 Tax=Saccharicrinis fermentans DSM 9555 = JCM 21142 TaxID=869213 RepID=W7Y769_9BACT|nr:FAD-dependent oxidoreductase [Saccharicrinis fermentans]GAF04087.1 3-ketosteroid-delta-1-dehydrogenase [Saccharicrinis fermentans DSM 9555 = JCM 21142]
MKTKNEKYEVVVVGGGMAGFCAAVSSARMGRKTCLIQNRPVFGGNCSSEIGVTIHGAAAFHAYARETGIISELLIEERSQNHAEIYENGWINSVWDMVMYDMAVKEEDLTFYLNTDMRDVKMSSDNKIEAVVAYIQSAETELIIEGDIFADCTGDGIVADRAGCEWRWGSESKSEFNEIHAPEVGSKEDVMGNSIHFRCKDMGRPVPFKAPDWAVKHDNPEYFYNQGRIPKDKRGGFWWLEIGVPYNTIYDNEDIRHELTRHTLGVWDWMKNCDPKMKEETKNYAIDWIGQVPGKRENRRIMGEYFMTENDIQEKTVFRDEIGFGGWFVDLHTPGGLLARHAEASAATDGEEYNTFDEYMVKSYCGPYGFPLRSLIARDVDNLMMAGRNISCSHAALGTLRVMGTTAVMGEAIGVAASTAIKHGVNIKEVPQKYIYEVQQNLLRNGCFLPNVKNTDKKDLALKAKIIASSEDYLLGAGPESKGFHEGLAIWKDQPQYHVETLETIKGQIVGIGSDRLDSVSVCLTNTSDIEQEVEAYIRPIDSIWDYRVDANEVIASAILKVPVGEKVWIDWEVNLTKENGLPLNQYVRIDLGANNNLEWHEAGCVIPGHTAMYQIGKNKMRRYYNGNTLSFKVSPAQNCFKATNIITGESRPHSYTNVWISNRNNPLDQWLQLIWDTPQDVSLVELTFPGHLLREYHAYAPLYRDPQCPKDLEIQGFINGGWVKIAEINDNYQRQRKVKLDKSYSLSQLRIVIKTTNGDASAMIYEVRVY